MSIPDNPGLNNGTIQRFSSNLDTNRSKYINNNDRSPMITKTKKNKEQDNVSNDYIKTYDNWLISSLQNSKKINENSNELSNSLIVEDENVSITYDNEEKNLKAAGCFTGIFKNKKYQKRESPREREQRISHHEMEMKMVKTPPPLSIDSSVITNNFQENKKIMDLNPVLSTKANYHKNSDKIDLNKNRRSIYPSNNNYLKSGLQLKNQNNSNMKIRSASENQKYRPINYQNNNNLFGQEYSQFRYNKSNNDNLSIKDPFLKNPGNSLSNNDNLNVKDPFLKSSLENHNILKPYNNRINQTNFYAKTSEQSINHPKRYARTSIRNNSENIRMVNPIRWNKSNSSQNSIRSHNVYPISQRIQGSRSLRQSKVENPLLVRYGTNIRNNDINYRHSSVRVTNREKKEISFNTFNNPKQDLNEVSVIGGIGLQKFKISRNQQPRRDETYVSTMNRVRSEDNRQRISQRSLNYYIKSDFKGNQREEQKLTRESSVSSNNQRFYSVRIPENKSNDSRFKTKRRNFSIYETTSREDIKPITYINNNYSLTSRPRNNSNISKYFRSYRDKSDERSFITSSQNRNIQIYSKDQKMNSNLKKRQKDRYQAPSKKYSRLNQTIIKKGLKNDTQIKVPKVSNSSYFNQKNYKANSKIVNNLKKGRKPKKVNKNNTEQRFEFYFII